MESTQKTCPVAWGTAKVFANEFVEHDKAAEAVSVPYLLYRVCRQPSVSRGIKAV